MKIDFKDNEIIIHKELSPIDDQIIEFLEILTGNNIRYALFSKYILNLFGNKGANENVDILIQKISFEKFLKLWLEIENLYLCRNTNDPIDAYHAYLKNHHYIVFAKKDGQIPDIRIKIIRNEFDRYALKYRKKVIIGERRLYISPIELQISNYLFLGSEKDIEDARFLHSISGEKLNMSMMEKLLREFEIPEGSFDKYLKL